MKNNDIKKKTTNTTNKDKWKTTEGAMRPVDLNKIQWANKPKASK